MAEITHKPEIIPPDKLAELKAKLETFLKTGDSTPLNLSTYGFVYIILNLIFMLESKQRYLSSLSRPYLGRDEKVIEGFRRALSPVSQIAIDDAGPAIDLSKLDGCRRCGIPLYMMVAEDEKAKSIMMPCPVCHRLTLLDTKIEE